MARPKKTTESKKGLTMLDLCDDKYAPTAEFYSRCIEIAIFNNSFDEARSIINRCEQEWNELYFPQKLTKTDHIIRLESHGLDLRICNALEEKGIHTIQGLYVAGPSYIVTIPNMGTTSVLKIEKALRSAGLPLWNTTRCGRVQGIG